MKKEIEFTKMEGLGNDYVYLDYTHKEENFEEVSNLAVKLSDRHFGIGGDGIILICSSKIADFRMSMYNADGSRAEMCGNGIRCVGKYVYDKGLTQSKNITIETLAGVKYLELNTDEENKVETVKVDMGEPILGGDKIPAVVNEKNKVCLKILDKEFECTCVSMGNPHAVTYVIDVGKFDIQKYGSLMEVDEHFPKKANIEFIQLEDRENIKMRVWERGTGETLACGTGACASVVSSIINGYTDRKVTVQLLGGKLYIEWNENNNHVYMTGPATTVFEGRYIYKNG